MLPVGHPVLANPIQRRVRQMYHYPNGSEIIVRGLDDPQKVMSSEYDLIYVQETKEIDEGAWEDLLSRRRNLAGSGLFYRQMIGDTNPGAPTHWIKRRADKGDLLLLYTTHKDNPLYYDQEKQKWTEEGERYFTEVLDKLTGIRRLRLRDGLWVQAEGVIYDNWRPSVHLFPSFQPPIDWPRYWSVDFGFMSPFVCLWAAKDHDGRLYVYKEFYGTRRITADWAALIRKELDAEARLLSDGRDIEAVRKRILPQAIICDHDPGEYKTLERGLGLGTIRARKNEKKRRIELVKSRLAVQGDGKPRLFVCRNALVERDRHLDEAKLPMCLAEEMECYTWRPNKDEPEDENDHGCDALLYLVSYHDSAGLWEAPTVASDARAEPSPDELSIETMAAPEPRIRFGQGGVPSRRRKLFG